MNLSTQMKQPSLFEAEAVSTSMILTRNMRSSPWTANSPGSSS